MEGKSSTSNSSSNANQLQVAPFVAKTYEMVSDPRTDALIRWGRGNNSFLVLDPALFSQLLLPSYFKHGNFSSFVRQLNTYGFRKVDPDKWEFAHESFLRGQTHLLPLIVRRRKKEDGNSSGEREGTSAGVEEEDEMLLHEVGKLRMEQQALEEELDGMNRRLQATEKRPQQMISFLSQVAEDPDFLPRLIISKKEQHKIQQQQLAAEKKRRLLIPPPPHPPPPPPPPPPPLPHAPQLTTSGPVPYPTAGVAHIAGYNDGVAVAPAIPTSSSIGIDSSGSQLLFLPEFGVSPATAPAFPFSLLGEGFL